MSRIGKIPVKLPEGVKVELEGRWLKVSGPKGELTMSLPEKIKLNQNDKEVFLEVDSKNPALGVMHGTSRALLANMVKGVSEGWSKKLELVGTGFRAEVQGGKLTLNIGYSHPVVIEAPKGITFSVEKNVITIEGIDKEKVGQISAEIRAKRPPEPYKGKGIIYAGEIVRRKPGKAAKAQGAVA
jgi:large subunit ribosomal protein L6